jgi:hypothetical protein
MAFEITNWDNPKETESLLEGFEVQTDNSALEKYGLQDPESDPNIIPDSVKENKDDSLLENIEKEKTDNLDKSKDDSPEIDSIASAAATLLAEQGVISLYEDYEIKTKEDLVALVKDNIQDKLSEVNQNIFQEQLEALPPQFQSIMKYGLSGGTDVKSLLESWGEAERVFALDITSDTGKEQVVRDYLRLTKYGSDEEINQDIQTWKDLGTLDKKAEAFKPKLEEHQMRVIAAKEKEADDVRQQELQYTQQYIKAVGQVLSKEDINGLKLDKQTKQFIYQNVQPIYQSQLTGKPIDALEAVVEELKYGQNANPEFYSQLLLFATQPEVFMETLKLQLKNNVTIEQERKLRKQVKEGISGTPIDNDHKRSSKKPEELKW